MRRGGCDDPRRAGDDCHAGWLWDCEAYGGDVMTKAFNEIAALRANAKQFETFWARYKKHIENPNIDKYAAKFGGDPRFSNFKVVTFFDSHSGVYGSSSCIKFGHFDDGLAQEYMVRAMNCLQAELFAKCAELMRADAAKKVSKAQEEVDAMRAALDACLAESGAADEAQP
jgi:hypothetical protein